MMTLSFDILHMLLSQAFGNGAAFISAGDGLTLLKLLATSPVTVSFPNEVAVRNHICALLRQLVTPSTWLTFHPMPGRLLHALPGNGPSARAAPGEAVDLFCHGSFMGGQCVLRIPYDPAALMPICALCRSSASRPSLQAPSATSVRMVLRSTSASSRTSLLREA